MQAEAKARPEMLQCSLMVSVACGVLSSENLLLQNTYFQVLVEAYEEHNEGVEA